MEDDNAHVGGGCRGAVWPFTSDPDAGKDLTAEWTAIGIAFVAEKRNDNHVRLDSSYIPPMLNACNSPQLYSMVNDLTACWCSAASRLGRLRQPGRFNTSELIEFTLLSLVNRHRAKSPI
ncbi:type VI secretion system baseplate subunit TssK [Enterobacter cloacae subsp. cloacae]|nr:type VI secretion system baseplate subunit TssK [Enterobacter cloacae subsp. cloacae]